MFKKLKEYRKDKKEKNVLAPEEKKKRAIILLSCYFAFFLLMLFLIVSTNGKNTDSVNNAYETLNDIKNPINKRLSNYVYDNNYKYEFYISSNLILKGEKEDKKEYGIKTYNNNQTEYYINNNNYYLKNNNIEEKVKDKIVVYRKLLEETTEYIEQVYGKCILDCSKVKGGIFIYLKFKDEIDNRIFESVIKYFIDKNQDKETRINICCFLKNCEIL